MIVAPSRISNVGALSYHLATGELERDVQLCESRCLYAGPWLAKGDTTGITVTARHEVAETARACRGTGERSAAAQRRWWQPWRRPHREPARDGL
jgi:hypothetical protein